MSVNGSQWLITLVLALICILSMGCGERASDPDIVWLTASSSMSPGDESLRVDVVVDLHNPLPSPLSEVRLSLGFFDGTTVEFEWEEIGGYAIATARRVIEVRVPVTEASMLGGAAGIMALPSGEVAVYALDVRSAELFFIQGGDRRTMELGRQVSAVMRDTFSRVQRMDASLRAERERRLRRLQGEVWRDE